jgi:hypothetical protein
MRIITSLFFLVSLAGAAWAGLIIPGTVGAPGPEMSAGYRHDAGSWRGLSYQAT